MLSKVNYAGKKGMRLAIISDCHFGYNEDALPQAREAMLIALQMKADAIILPGDIYDTRIPKQETLHESIRLFSEILAKGSNSKIEVSEVLGNEEIKRESKDLPLLAIWGTHERRSKGLTNVIQIMDAVGLLINFHAKTIVLGKGEECVAVQGLGGVPEEYFRRTLQVAEFKPRENAYNIFVFHQNLQELLPIEKEEYVSAEELPEGFDLYVNGHIHWNHDLNVGGRRLLVAGSTVLTQMKKNEEKPKGFYLFDTESKKSEFVRIPHRPFYFREINLENGSKEQIEMQIDKIMKEILKNSELKKPLVKIKLRGTATSAASISLDLDKIIKNYAREALLYIDKDFDSAELRDKIEFLRRIRSEGKSAKELGWEILQERMKERKLEMENAHELLELLAEGEVEKAIAAA